VKEADKLLELILAEDWWMWDDGDFTEFMVKAEIAEWVEYTEELANEVIVEDADIGEQVCVLKKKFRPAPVDAGEKG
jgi:hypothetical protein